MINFFGGGKEITVASTVYNMAGEEKDRPQFLKSLVLRNILSNTKFSMGETIPKGYLRGPAIKFRSFYRWAEKNYDLVGMPTGTVSAGKSITPSLVEPHIPHAPDEKLWVQSAEIDSADYGDWVSKWFIENAPELLESNWNADLDDTTNTITITFDPELPARDPVSFVAENFQAGERYIFALYNTIQDPTLGDVTPGTPVDLEPGEDGPSMAGWTLVTEASRIQSVILNRTVRVADSFSDGRPDEVDVTTTMDTGEYEIRSAQYRKDIYIGQDPDSDEDDLVTKRQLMNFYNNGRVITDVTETTTVTVLADGTERTRTRTVTQDEVETTQSYRLDVQHIIEARYSPLKMFIYKLGGDVPELNNLVTMLGDYGKFYPMIPIRLKNKMIDIKWDPAEGPDADVLYKLVKKAYKKATDGGKYDKIVDEIAKHKSIKDIDYAYVVFGVSLNVVEKACRKYIYEFFERLAESQQGGENLYENHLSGDQAYNDAYKLWMDWKNGGGIGTEPPLPSRPSLVHNQIKIATEGPTKTDYDIRIDWTYMAETKNQTGQGKPGAKTGDLWFQDMGVDVWARSVYGGYEPGGPGTGGILGKKVNLNPNRVSKIRLYWQYEANKFKYMDAVGLAHRNYIYGGKNVLINAPQALKDTKESGFIIPLHNGTYRGTSMVPATQMGTACVFIVFNCYTVVTQSFWDSWFFKILLVIVVAVVSVVMTGGAGIGLLGAHMAVGGAFGLTGMAAAIVGSIANALAALVLTSIIGQLSNALFGEMWGAVIGAILSFVAMQSIMNFQTTGNFGFNLADLMKAENLLKLTDALVSGYQGFVQGEIAGMQTEMERIQSEANAELKRVQEQFTSLFGFGGGTIDPLMFVAQSPVMAESRDTFLQRTLMTGSDIADMSNGMLTDYTELMLTLPNAFT